MKKVPSQEQQIQAARQSWTNGPRKSTVNGRVMANSSTIEDLVERQQISNEHPTPEQMLIRKAEERLTPKQREMWELWSYDRLTQDEIAKQLNKTQPLVSQTIKACEKRIQKWVKQHWAVYETLKEEYGNDY